jgi:hypothetical protein
MRRFSYHKSNLYYRNKIIWVIPSLEKPSSSNEIDTVFVGASYPDNLKIPQLFFVIQTMQRKHKPENKNDIYCIANPSRL